jgi:hypothetical protein
MRTERYFNHFLIALASAAMATFFLVACQQTQTPNASPVATESKVAPAATLAKDVYVIFEGPWAFAPDPKDANSVFALAPKTTAHRDLIVQTSDKTLASGIYDLSVPGRTGAAAGTVDPNILRAKIDPQSVQHALDSKSGRYAIRLPKPDEYLEATHYRSRAGSPYPPDVSTEKDYVTSVSLHYIVLTLTGFSLAGSPDNGTFNPLLLRVVTPTIGFYIEPAHDPDPTDGCHAHEREAFHDLAKLLNITLFVDYPKDPDGCRGKDPQNPRPVKAGMVPGFPGFFTGGSAGVAKHHLLSAVYFFGPLHDCKAPIIVGEP